MTALLEDVRFARRARRACQKVEIAATVLYLKHETPVLLEIEDLQVDFDSRIGPLPAVDGVSLTVDPGETVALVGESGCGI